MSSTKMVAWGVWIIASVFYAYQFILRVMPNVMLDDIMLQFNIGAATFGQFSGVYYIGYSLMHLPIGILLDRYGPKKVIPVCILVTVLGILPLLFADNWIYPIAGRLLIGMGSSAAILGVFKIVRMTFCEDRFPRMLSFSVTIGLIGAIYGGGPMSYMRETFGYQAVVQIFSILGICLALVTYLMIPNQKKPVQSTVISDLKEVFGNRKVIWSCLFAGMMVGPLEGFADVWGTAFLKQVYHFDGALAASLPSMIFIGMCFGGPLLSVMAEKIGNYLTTIILAGLGMAAAFIVFLNWTLSTQAIGFCFVVVGICSAYQILAIYKVSTYVRKDVAGLTTAVANMIIMTFGYAFHSVIGSMINLSGGPHSPQALIYGITVIPVALCIGTAGFLFLLSFEKVQDREKDQNRLKA